MARILVVEPDSQVREFYEKALKNAGHRVHCVEDGGRALEDIGLLAPGAAFDVMVTSMENRMPGDELSRRVRSISQKTKTIMISTGLPGENHACDMILPKPVPMALLLRAVACFTEP